MGEPGGRRRKLELRKNEERTKRERRERRDPVIPMKLGDNGTMVPGMRSTIETTNTDDQIHLNSLTQ